MFGDEDDLLLDWRAVTAAAAGERRTSGGGRRKRTRRRKPANEPQCALGIMLLLCLHYGCPAEMVSRALSGNKGGSFSGVNGAARQDHGPGEMRNIGDWVENARKGLIERVIEQRGIKLCGRIDRCGPCPRCGGRDRFAINVKKQVWNCRGCGVGGDVIALVQHLDDCTFVAALETLASERSAARVSAALPIRPESPDLYERQQHQKAAWLWSRGQSITGTIAEKYLRSRGITCQLPATLRYLAPSKPEHHSAMMAAFGIADEPEAGVLAAPRRVDAVHLTLLNPDGTGKADIRKPKIVVARPLGRPISLAPANDHSGIQTAHA